MTLLELGKVDCIHPNQTVDSYSVRHNLKKANNGNGCVCHGMFRGLISNSKNFFGKPDPASSKSRTDLGRCLKSACFDVHALTIG